MASRPMSVVGAALAFHLSAVLSGAGAQGWAFGGGPGDLGMTLGKLLDLSEPQFPHLDPAVGRSQAIFGAWDSVFSM